MNLPRPFVVAALMLALSACSSNPAADPVNRAPIVRNTDASIDGRSEVVKRGDTIAVHLDSPPSTGYRWELTRLAGASVVQVGLADFQPETAAGVPRVGAAGHTTFRFRAVQPGTSGIELAYRRPFEPGAPAARTVRFELAVP